MHALPQFHYLLEQLMALRETLAYITSLSKDMIKDTDK